MRFTRRIIHVPFRRRGSIAKTLPYEIWLHIATFIPPALLRNLYSVNRSFFDIAMNARYNEVQFVDFDAVMLKKFNRLK
jgi:hypothetical protein